MNSPERLYSRGYENKCAVDDVAEQHKDVHALLIRWGDWARNRGRSRLKIASLESLYSRSGTPASTAPPGVDEKIVAVERAVLSMPYKHKRTMLGIYVWGWAADTVRRSIARVSIAAYQHWTFNCRAMVVNRLRRQGY